MTADQALAYLYAHDDRERMTSEHATFDLRRVEHLLHDLGDPHLGRVTVHVAGTKGKGSVAAMMASVLTTAGYTTGLYTSPHLCDFRERIRLDGKAIAPDAFAEAATQVRGAAERYHLDPRYGHLTTFELTTATAFLHFCKTGATAQVLEVGIGGRLDATNVIPAPEVAIITPLSYDHMDVLGNTLSAIAMEKAGIIKPGGAVVIGPQEPEARAVIARRCYELGAALYDQERRVQWRRTALGIDGQQLHARALHGGWDLDLPLLGDFQAENAATVTLAFEVMRDRGLRMRREALEAGLAAVSWPGRLQVVRRQPAVILDGAHNGASARRLVQALAQDIPHRRLAVIVGVAQDKDVGAMAAYLGPIADEVVVTRYRSARSSSPERLADAFRAHDPAVRVEPSVDLAIRHALDRLSNDDALCITGSLYVVGEALEALGMAESVLDL